MNATVSPDRHSAMTDALANVRAARSRALPLETVLLILGAVCLPVGLVAIIVGWYGVAHTGRLYEQNSYLISGGILGLALVFIGGFLYFGYWMTRQVHATTTASEQLLRAVARLEAQFAATPSAPPPSAPAATKRVPLAPTPPGGATSRPPSTETTLVATARGTLLHRPDCSVVAGKSNTKLVPVGTPGYSLCRICAPSG
jgi:hypothetical protein